MNICFMCDLHLPFDKSALQYDVLDFAIKDIQKTAPDCIICAGDMTCDGNEKVYFWFIEKMQELKIPFINIPGNSDLRCGDSLQKIYETASPCRNDINGTLIFAVNDSDRAISEEAFRAIEEADAGSIVIMHHPEYAFDDETAEKLRKWRATHESVMLFYGHRHKSEVLKNEVCLQAMDPDKAIGECPCITYYDTDTKRLSKSYYHCPVPKDLTQNFGISCYNVTEQISFAAEKHLKALELRPTCLDTDEKELTELIDKWRNAGGENLSIHLPDIRYEDGKVVPDGRLDGLIEFAKRVRAQRFTQHVPRTSVKTLREDKAALGKIADFLAEKLNSIEHDVVLGVENMHMTSKDTPDDNRRFGYVPEECLEFMNLIALKCRHKVGINFDIGHARNNAPYSQKYQIGTWFSLLGKYIVGYHIHQVTEEGGVTQNHMPITELYGRLISYASFFKCWDIGKIGKAPVIFEMRPEGAYKTTLETFNIK